MLVDRLVPFGIILVAVLVIFRADAMDATVGVLLVIALMLACINDALWQRKGEE